MRRVCRYEISPLVSAITPPFKDAFPDLPKILMNTYCFDLYFSKGCGYVASLPDSVLRKRWVLHPDTQGTAERLPSRLCKDVLFSVSPKLVPGFQLSSSAQHSIMWFIKAFTWNTLQMSYVIIPIKVFSCYSCGKFSLWTSSGLWNRLALVWWRSELSPSTLQCH